MMSRNGFKEASGKCNAVSATRAALMASVLISASFVGGSPGVLRFAAGHTSSKFVVLIVNKWRATSLLTNGECTFLPTTSLWRPGGAPGTFGGCARGAVQILHVCLWSL